MNEKNNMCLSYLKIFIPVIRNTLIFSFGKIMQIGNLGRFTITDTNKLTFYLKNRLLNLWNSFILPSLNMQNMKPVQNCTDSIFL